MGYRAPDKKKSGKIIKFIIKLNPCISFIFDANIRPMPMNVKAIVSMKTIDNNRGRIPLILKPMKNEIPRSKMP